MDFSTFDSRAAAELGRELHIKHPATGEPIYDGDKPCVVIVRGTESRKAQAALSKVRKAKMDGEEENLSAATIEDMHAKLVETAKPLVVGFKNINRGDEPAKAPKDVDWFLNLQLINGIEGEQSFVEQIVAFATKRSNFLGNA